jgi:hypothetical protein
LRGKKKKTIESVDFGYSGIHCPSAGSGKTLGKDTAGVCGSRARLSNERVLYIAVTSIEHLKDPSWSSRSGAYLV